MRRALALIVAVFVPLVGAQKARAESPTRLAILPIVVHTVENKEYLRAGLADMLASRLGRVPNVAVIRIEGDGHAVTDIKKAKQAGEAVDAEYVLFGSFTQFGEGASLDLQCASVSAEVKESPRSIFIQSGTLAEIIPRLDQVAEKVGRYLAVDAVISGDAPGSLPAVGAPAPSDGNTNLGEPLQDALSELEALRGRVDALEERVFSPAIEPIPEVDMRSGGDGFEIDPELHSDLR